MSLSNETRLDEPAAAGQRGVAAADVADGSPACPGCLDLVVANQTANSISILTGNGNGTFTAFGNNIAVGTSPLSVATGDCNADGLVDIFVANNGGSSITVLKNTGSGFTQASGSPIALSAKPVFVLSRAGQLPTSPALDINGDGKLDLAVAIKADDKIITLNGVGDCTFVTSQTDVYGGNGPETIAAGNLDGVNGVDLAISDRVTGLITVLLNGGGGTFPNNCSNGATCKQLASTAEASYVALADVDADGDLDVLAIEYDNGANTSALGINRYLNNGSATFSAVNQYGTGGKAPEAAIAANFGGDANVDVVALNKSTKTLGYVAGQGLTGFASAVVSNENGSGGEDITAGDFNGDGYLDVATANKTSNNISVCLNSAGSPGTFSCNPTTGAASGFGSSPRGIAVADMGTIGSTTPDGNKDIVVVNEVSDDVSILINNGSGSFTSLFKPPADLGAFGATTLRDVVALDADHDGITDLAIAACGGSYLTHDKLVVVRDRNFSTSSSPVMQLLTGNDCPTAVVAADFNGDGWADLAVANQNTNDVSIFKNLGPSLPGSFQWVRNVCSIGGPTCSNAYLTDIAAGDFGTSAGNGTLDGKPDLVVSNKNTSNFTVLFGDGSSSFNFTNSATVGTAPNGDPQSVDVGDFNADGKLDVVIANHNTANTAATLSNGLQVFLGQGGNIFNTPTGLAAGKNPTAVVAREITNDTGSRVDIVATYEGSDYVGVFEGKGNGTFEGAVAKTTGLNPKAVALGDVNPSSPQDIVTANSGTDDVSLVFNNTAVCGDSVVSGGEACDPAGGSCSLGCGTGTCSVTCYCR